MQGSVPRDKVNVCEDKIRLTRTGTFIGHESGKKWRIMHFSSRMPTPSNGWSLKRSMPSKRCWSDPQNGQKAQEPLRQKNSLHSKLVLAWTMQQKGSCIHSIITSLHFTGSQQKIYLGTEVIKSKFGNVYASNNFKQLVWIKKAKEILYILPKLDKFTFKCSKIKTTMCLISVLISCRECEQIVRIIKN